MYLLQCSRYKRHGNERIEKFKNQNQCIRIKKIVTFTIINVIGNFTILFRSDPQKSDLRSIHNHYWHFPKKGSKFRSQSWSDCDLREKRSDPSYLWAALCTPLQGPGTAFAEWRFFFPKTLILDFEVYNTYVIVQTLIVLFFHF